jgi:hypothetical protein
MWSKIAVGLLVLSVSACSTLTNTKPSVVAKPQQEATEALVGAVNDINTKYDSFYTTKCEWPRWLGEIKTEQDSLYQIQEIMTKYEPCFVRHNSWVDEYNGR